MRRQRVSRPIAEAAITSVWFRIDSRPSSHGGTKQSLQEERRGPSARFQWKSPSTSKPQGHGGNNAENSCAALTCFSHRHCPHTSRHRAKSPDTNFQRRATSFL